MDRAEWADDRYVLHKVLGEGGAGRVWLAEDRLRPGRPVALKELVSGADGDRSGSDERLRREFAVLYSLRHPGLAEAFELDLDPRTSRPRFSQEWIEGRTILDAVAHEGPESLTGFAVEALRTLRFVHDFGLVHRDIKPDNLLIRERAKLGYRLVLVDFGLAIDPAAQPLEALRLSGALPYLAPELFDNEKPEAATDLYALGAVLYEAIHGHPPYVPDPRHLDRFIAAAREGRRSRPPLPEGFDAGLGEWLEAMLSSKHVRPSSATEALDRLNACCGTRHELDSAADRAARLLSGAPAGREETIEALREALADPQGPRLVVLFGDPGSGKVRLLQWLYTDAIRRGARVALELDPRTAAPGELVLVEDGYGLNEQDARAIERCVWSRDPAARVVVAADPHVGLHPRLSGLLERGSGTRCVSRIDLAPLETAQLRRLAERAHGGPVAAERIRRLAERSDGRPDVVESLLIDPDRTGNEEPGIDAIDRRLESLSENTRAWLTALAVFGDGAGDEMIRELAGLDSPAATLASQEALCAGLAWRRSPGWRMTRPLRNRFLGRLTGERSVELHRLALDAMGPSLGDATEAARAARLNAAAGRVEDAVEAASRAAELLEKSGDPTAAARRWGEALRYLGRERSGRGALRLRQAEAWLKTGQSSAAVRAFSAAHRWCEQPAERLLAAARRTLARVQAGQFATALEEAERIAHRALAAGAPEQLALARRVAGIALARSGREQEALPLLDDAYEMLERLEDRAGLAAIVHARANCRLRLGRDDAEQDFLEALELYAEARERGRPDEPAELKTRIGLAIVQLRGGRLDDADRTLAAAGEAAAAGGNLDLQQVALSRRAVVALERGAFDRAMDLAGEAADLSALLGDIDRVLVNRCHGADARIRCGRAAGAVTELRRLLDEPLDRAEPQNVDYARMVLADAMMRSERGDDGAVRDLLDGCRRRARRRGLARAHLFALVLELERRARPGCPDAFDAAWREYEAVAREAGEVSDAEIVARGSLARCVDALRRGSYEVAAAASAIVLREATGASGAIFRVRAYALRAQALDRLGNEREAKQALADGRAALEEVLERIEDDDVRRDLAAHADWAPLAEESFLTSRDNHARLLALYDMLRVLNSSTDPDTLLESILDLALKALGAERGMILLKQRDDRDEEAFAVHLARNLDADTMDDVRSYSRRIVAAAASGQSLLALDAGTDARFQNYKSVSLYGIRSLICVPLRSRDQIIGTVYLDSRNDGRLFTQDDLRFLEAFADQAALALGNVMQRVELEQHNRRLQALAETRTSYHNLIGRCPEMQRVFDTIEKYAATDLPVLVRGESGTGKEIVARAIHFNGPRRKRPFISENCAALPETLLESELFGHVRGAFTGAERDHPGLFEQAHGGTLFLDEIGDMSAAMQARLLRILEEKRVRRVGGEKAIEIDVRVLAATHRDLKAAVEAGTFREDLFYRLQVLQVALPPLRDRPGDVELLCDHFLTRIAAERDLPPLRLAPEVLALLRRHRWPGNVRELENALQRLVVLAADDRIDATVVASDPELRARLGHPEMPAPDAGISLEAGEKEQLMKALDAAGGNRSAAARLLNVSRATFYRKLRRHGL